MIMITMIVVLVIPVICLLMIVTILIILILLILLVGAIIFDALNSIRQDRFYTSDYNPELYTDWGFAHTKSTNLVDLLNRHLDMGLDRNMMLSRLPSWKGVNRWSDLRGFPANAIRSELVRAIPCLGGNPFDDRGFPILRQQAGDLVPPSEIV